MKILFINSSPNQNGHTAQLAETLLAGHSYDTLHLTDYRLNVYGQTLAGDQFDQILNQLDQYDVLVLGSPVYWHNMSGALRTFLDRFYSDQDYNFQAQLYFIFQGAAPEDWMLEHAEYTIKRFASRYGFVYKGMAVNQEEANQLNHRL